MPTVANAIGHIGDRAGVPAKNDARGSCRQWVKAPQGTRN
jgi:hypothetical protein